MSIGHNYRRRQRLYESNPFCYYCGVRTILLDESDYCPSLKPVGRYATIEHLVNKSNPDFKILRRNPETNKKVNACYKCNNDRAKEISKIVDKNKSIIYTPTNRKTTGKTFFEKRKNRWWRNKITKDLDSFERL